MPGEMYQKSEKLGKEQAIEITAQVQGRYTNFEQNLARNVNFVISKINESEPLFGKCRLTATRFQKLMTRALSKEK